jgi:hypothetical protein
MHPGVKISCVVLRHNSIRAESGIGCSATVDNFVTAKASNFNKQAANASKHNKFKSFQSESTSWRRRQGQQKPEISSVLRMLTDEEKYLSDTIPVDTYSF